MKYEAHITFDIKYEVLVKEVSETYSDWKFSKFAGDPILGEATFCYLSQNIDTDFSSYNYIAISKEKLLSKMMLLCGELKERGIKPLRAKIESVEFDERFYYV